MIEPFSALWGAGLFVTLWSVFSLLYELVRHKSMLEYPDPNIEWYSFIPLALGIAAWIIGGYFA